MNRESPGFIRGECQESQLAEKANEEGSKGWEVVQVVPVLNGLNGNINTQYTILFRRAADVKD